MANNDLCCGTTPAWCPTSFGQVFRFDSDRWFCVNGLFNLRVFMRDPFNPGLTFRRAIYWKPEDRSSAGVASSTFTETALNTCAPADLFEVSRLAGPATVSSLEMTGNPTFQPYTESSYLQG